MRLGPLGSDLTFTRVGLAIMRECEILAFRARLYRRHLRLRVGIDVESSLGVAEVRG